jgi:ATP-binding cassette subfamily F protein 3
MLTISEMSFTLAGKPLFHGASARVPDGARAGVVGPNGAGKSTLFRLIDGAWAPDQGAVAVRPGARVGGVAQEAPAGPDSLLDIVLAADVERAALLAEAETAGEPLRIAEIQTRLADIEAHSAEARAAAILAGLGFGQAAQGRPAAEFSGGWRMRVALAAVLFARPDLLLLDEPTNYLDLEGALWLEGFLARYPATALVISHDRGLLNRATTSTLALEGGRLEYAQGSFETFDRRRRERLAVRQAAAAKQAEKRAHMQAFVDRFRYKASKAKQAQSRLKALERMQAVELPEAYRAPPFRFPQPEALSPPIVAMESASVGYDGRAVLSRLSLRVDPDDRIALLGANGEGKSTFAKLLADRLPLMAGDMVRSPKLRVGFFAQHQLEELRRGETPLQHIQRLRLEARPAELRARLAAGGTGAELAETAVERLSGGQRARLLMTLMALDAPHMLILDEPTNHLDMESRDALARALNDYEGAVILVSHDFHLIEAVAERLWLVRDGRVRPYEGDLEDYRALLLSERAGAEAAEPAKPHEARARRADAAERRRALKPLREAAREAESRVEALVAMRAKLDARLADPALYAEAGSDRLEALQIKRAEIEHGLARAEALWLEAEERLERAEAEEA